MSTINGLNFNKIFPTNDITFSDLKKSQQNRLLEYLDPQRVASLSKQISIPYEAMKGLIERAKQRITNTRDAYEAKIHQMCPKLRENQPCHKTCCLYLHNYPLLLAIQERKKAAGLVLPLLKQQFIQAPVQTVHIHQPTYQYNVLLSQEQLFDFLLRARSIQPQSNQAFLSQVLAMPPSHVSEESVDSTNRYTLIRTAVAAKPLTIIDDAGFLTKQS